MKTQHHRPDMDQEDYEFFMKEMFIDDSYFYENWLNANNYFNEIKREEMKYDYEIEQYDEIDE